MRGNLRLLDQEVIRVLLVEDNPEHTEMIGIFLGKSSIQNFELTTAPDLTSAIQNIKQAPFDVILLDLTLPESTGLTTFFSMHAASNGIPIVILSGMDDEYVAIEAMRGGAQDYLVKGHADHHLIVRSIRYAIERKRAEITLRQREEHFRSLIENATDMIALIDEQGIFSYVSPSHQHVLGYQTEDLIGKNATSFIHRKDQQNFARLLEHILANPQQMERIDFRFRDVDCIWRYLEGVFTVLEDNAKQQIAINSRDVTERVEKEDEISHAYEATLAGWSRALELRDEGTQGHSSRVTEMTLELADALGMTEEDREHIRRGTLLHDIGKMGVPDEILLKPGPLDENEVEIMRRHTDYAYDMLAPIGYLQPALDIPLFHHEHWDGNGYPRGLEGEEIPLPARVFAVIDVWDALTSDRPYRRAWSKQEAIDYIRKQSGTQFEPRVVESFTKLVKAKYNGDLQV